MLSQEMIEDQNTIPDKIVEKNNTEIDISDDRPLVQPDEQEPVIEIDNSEDLLNICGGAINENLKNVGTLLAPHAERFGYLMHAAVNVKTELGKSLWSGMGGIGAAVAGYELNTSLAKKQHDKNKA